MCHSFQRSDMCFLTSAFISLPLTAHIQWITCLCDLVSLVIECTLLLLQTFSQSGPQCPYWRTWTKVPLFHVYITSSGSEKQEIQLPLMRKGLHTPLVLSTWNPGCYSVAETPQNNLSGKSVSVLGEETCMFVCFLNSMTNDLLLAAFSAISI